MQFLEWLAVASEGIGAETVLLGMIFGVVVLGVFGVRYAFAPGASVARRMQNDGQSDKRRDGQAKQRLRIDENESLWARLLRPLNQYVVPTSEERISHVRNRLTQAGFMGPAAVRVYYAVRVVLAIALPVVFAVLAPFILADTEVEQLVLIAGALSLAGLYMPAVIVTQRIQKRQQLAFEGFPDALDMLLVCVEAGLGLDSALNRVSQEITRAHPMLAEQFQLVALELRAGKSREQALRNLAQRVGIDEVRSFVNLLVQSENLGTSIAQALRVHADEMRKIRLARAEEEANKLPVKLAIPLVLLVLPALMLTVMSPAIISIIRNLLPSMGGAN